MANESDVIREDSLEQRNQALIKELEKLRAKPSGRIAYLLLVIGTILFSISIDYQQTLAAFLSLAFLFWGVLFLYVRPVNFVRREILFSIINETINNYSGENPFKSRVLFYSPTSITEYNNVYFIPIGDNLPSTAYSSLIENTPKTSSIGLGLSDFIERDYQISYANIETDKLVSLLKKIYEEEYELVKKFEPNIENESIYIKLNYGNKQREEENGSYKIYILCSIACAIAKNTHKIILMKIQEEKYESIEYQINEWDTENIE